MLERARAHLGGCASCRREAEAYDAFLLALDRLRHAEVRCVVLEPDRETGLRGVLEPKALDRVEGGSQVVREPGTELGIGHAVVPGRDWLARRADAVTVPAHLVNVHFRRHAGRAQGLEINHAVLCLDAVI